MLMGMSPLVSQAFGAGDRRECRRVMVQGLWLAALRAVPMTVIPLFGLPIARALGQPEGVAQLAGGYLVAIAWGVLLASCLPAFADPVTAFLDVTVIHPDRPETHAMEPHSTVVVAGGRIAAVGRTGDVNVPSAATVVYGKGKFLIPGLVDAHVHFDQSGNLYARPDIADLTRWMPYAKEQARNRARLQETFAAWLRSGVTSVVDIGGPRWTFEVREVAHHYYRALPAGDIALATSWLTRAAQEAERASEHEEAARYFRFALDAVRLLSEPPEAQAEQLKQGLERATRMPRTCSCASITGPPELPWFTDIASCSMPSGSELDTTPGVDCGSLRVASIG
jgi:hypothetical protein